MFIYLGCDESFSKIAMLNSTPYVYNDPQV